jgi:outer membrane protein TolC
MKLKYIQLGFLFCICNAISAQDSSVFSFQDFYAQVVNYHPVSKQANLLTQSAKAELLAARGAFDPVISTNYENKTTDGKNSYTYFEPQIKIPTLIGVDVKAGYDQSDGIAVNNDRIKILENNGQYFPQYGEYGMLYAGVNVPILRGFQTDGRRASLRQAQYLQGLNEAERVKVINKLLLSAAKDYWEWQLAYEKLKLMQLSYSLAENRFTFISSRIKGGEDKPIDSVEALIELKRRETLLLETEVEFKNASLSISNYLWNDKNEALQLKASVYPSAIGTEIRKISTDSLQRMVNFTEGNHPELIKLQFKNKQLQVERKLAIENIKPQLNIEYYPFQTYSKGAQNDVNNIFNRQYKFGASFYSSLFLRKERGKLQQANLKLKNIDFEAQLTKRELVNEVFTNYNNLLNLEQLISIQDVLVKNATTLRDAEQTRFENGESSLFLVNTRERSLIDAQIKQVEINSKYAKAKVQIQWSSGIKLF